MTTFRIPAEVLKAAASFATLDKLRPAMTCVQVWNRPGSGLHVTATDAHILYSWKEGTEIPFEFEFLIDAKGLKINSKSEDFVFTIEEGELPADISGRILNYAQAKEVAAKTGEPYKEPVVHKLHRYPDWPQVVPASGKEKRWSVDCGDLQETIERIRRCANPISNQITLDFEKKMMVAIDSDFVIEARAALPFRELDKDIQKMGFCAPEFLKALSPFDKTQAVDISIWKPSRAVVIRGQRPVLGEDFVLLMPVMLSE